MIQKPDDRNAYHACRTHVSRGMLADLYQRPRLFEGRYITGTIPGKDPTPAMKLGTMIHALALEGRRIAIDPPAEHLTPSGKLSEKKATVEWVKEIEAGGYIVSDAETTERIEQTTDSVLSILKKLGEPQKTGIVETPIYWDHISGVGCRALPDILTPGAVIDLKTTDELDERKIASKIWELGYWLQVPHYLEAASKHYGYRISKFIFLFAETNQPYRCWMRELDEVKYLKWATDKRHQLIEEYQRRMAENDWADPGEETLESVELPKWAE